MNQIQENKNLTSISNLFKQSWELFKQGFWKLLVIKAIGIGAQIALVILLIIIIIISLALTGISLPEKIEMPILQSATVTSWQVFQAISKFSWPLIFTAVIIIGFLIVQYWISTSSFIMTTGITQNLSIKQALKMGWRRKYSFVWVSMLIGLIVGLGSLLFIVPGIIFAVWFSFAIYIFICEDIKGWQALKKSKELVKNYFWPIFARLALLGLIMLGINSINFIVQGLGFLLSIIFAIFVLVYNYVLYKDLVRVKN